MSKVPANRSKYLLSLSHELLSQSDRIRNLIGGAHWLSDGHHKELLLLSLLQRHLPYGMIASRGFVIHPDDPNQCSPEQDILIIDTLRESPVFNQSGVVITFPKLVVASLSVKATMKKEFVEDAVRGLNALRSVLSGQVETTQVWCGGYYYHPDETVTNNPNHAVRYIREAFVSHPIKPHPTYSVCAGPGMHCSGQDIALKLVGNGSQPEIRGYRCPGTATALFIAELLTHLAERRGDRESDYSRLADEEGYELFTPA